MAQLLGLCCPRRKDRKGLWAGVGSVVEHLPSVGKVLGSTSRITKKEEERP